MGEKFKVTAKAPEVKSENRASGAQKTRSIQCNDSPVDSVLYLQRTVGNQAVQKLIKFGALRTKLKIGLPGDIYEQEADRVAEQVIRMPEPHVSKGTMVSEKAGNTVRRSCPRCTKVDNSLVKEDEEELVQAKENSGDTPEIAPDIESRINSMKGGGQPLPEAVREFYEPRFGHDFSQVRLHTDAQAAEAASAVNALAYTVGTDVVFGAGQYAPGTMAGKRLLAHELTHVVQQNQQNLAKPSLKIANIRNGQQHEPNAQPMMLASGDTVTIQQRAIIPTLQLQPCRSLLEEMEVTGGRPGGIAAHTAITKDFISQVPTAKRVQIPAGSFAPWRTEGCGDDPAPDVINPVAYGGRAGQGIPDLACQNDRILELAEIKPATFDCLAQGDEQINNYKEKGNDQVYPLYAQWRRRLGIDRVDLMPTSRFNPQTPLPVEDKHVSVMWCGPGLIVYKAVQHPEVFICGQLGDKGATDKFLEGVLSKAMGQVDKYVDQVMEPAITKAISNLTLRQTIRLIYRYSRGALIKYITKNAGGGTIGTAIAQGILEKLPDEAAVDMIARWLEEQIGSKVEQKLRELAQSFKTYLLINLRQRMKNGLRNLLEKSLTAVCAGVFSISTAMLLKKLWEDLSRYAGETLGEVLDDLATAFVESAIKGLEVALECLLVVAAIGAVIAAVLFLPEELLVGAGAAIIRLLSGLPRLIPALSAG